MTGQLTIVIPGRPPNQNDFNRSGSGKQHWHQQRTIARHWRSVAAEAARNALPEGWVPLQRCRMAVTFVLPTRADIDPDNMVASTKHLTDGLVDAGVMVGDGIRVISGVSYGWRYERGVKAVEYTITPDDLEQVGAGL